ncbi:MAG: SDR family oxidoreductase, partial [Dehalococcoidia bacterium]|nr:SDR family oxidoreductase [Dehalococcoidia bacterium]
TEATAGVVARRAAAAGVTAEEIERQMAEGNSIRHLIDASEIAAVAVFLASPLARPINGDAIAAGGGAPRAIYL